MKNTQILTKEKEEVLQNEIIKRKDIGVTSFISNLGKGSYGKIKEVKTKFSAQNMILKIIFKRTETNFDINKITELRGPNIVKMFNLSTLAVEKGKEKENYSLLLMEKAKIRDLSRFTEYYNNLKLLNLCFDPFVKGKSENLLRFYSFQIVSGFATLYNYSYVHFDIKPENLLVFSNLKIKISDFDLLTQIKKGEQIKIPGGTNRFTGPEYYTKNYFKSEYATSQDYFGLGATLFYLKFGKNLLNYENYKDNQNTSNEIFEQINNKIEFIKSRQNLDLNFINFLCRLIANDYKERPNFENLFRNIWLNTNKKYIKEIFEINQNEEDKMLLEFQKSDYLMKNMKTKRKKILFKKKKINNEYFGFR